MFHSPATGPVVGLPIVRHSEAVVIRHSEAVRPRNLVLMDSILIEGLRVQAHVGVPLKERRRLQPVRIDLELQLNLRAAGRLDRIEKTLDYAAVAREVKALIRSRSFRLVEAMAEAIAARLLAKFKPSAVRIRIRKFSLPAASSVGVSLTRRRVC